MRSDARRTPVGRAGRGVSRAVAEHWIDAYGWARRRDHRVLAHLLGRTRRLLVPIFDPEIEFELGPGRRLVLPFSHDLPFIRADHPGYAENLRRVLWFLADRRDGAVMVDVGANVGDSVVLCHRDDVTIVAVEGLADFHELCRRNTADLASVLAVRATVGRAGESLSYEAAWGTAGTRPGDGGERAVDLAGVLADLGVGACDLVKIDTDGHDGEILLASREWIAETAPVLFFEYDPALHAGSTPLVEVVQLLAGGGHDKGLVYDETGALVGAGRIAELIGDLDAYLRRRGRGYWDICLLPDDDLFAALAEHERALGVPVPVGDSPAGRR